MTILVTGAYGFIGSGLCAKLRQNAYSVRGAVRCITPSSNKQDSEVGNISPTTDWTPVLQNVTHVIHLAARVHIMNDKSVDPLAEFRRMNVETTENLARQAAQSGVKRFIFLSSIKVNGESTEPGRPFTADAEPLPIDPYGISKYEAEQRLQQISGKTGMEIVIIRPPLVYGRGVKANFESMIRWVMGGVPLPLGGFSHNRRSLVALDNLVDLIKTCLHHPAAANQTFLVGDGEDLSTVELLRRIASATQSPARLFYVPPALLRLGAKLINKPDIYQRLGGSLQIDMTKTRQRLGWNPPISVDEGLRMAVSGFRQ